MRSLLHCVAFLFFCPFCPFLPVAASERPNILFLIADDLGWADVGWHGSEIDTPNLDGLSRQGVILDQHYVTPMCSSTRACLLSGQYSTRFGLDSATNERVFPPGMTTLASALQSLGYETGLTGKWHLGSKPQWGPLQFGFTRSYGSFAGGVDQYLHLYKRGPYQKTWHRNDQYVSEKGHATDLIAREAIRWIERSDRNHPWFIQVAFTAVHVPIQEPEKWVNPYADRIKNESRRHYAACATHMDHTIGEMMEAIERAGQKENTLIIFTSDNGGSGPWNPRGLYPGKYDPSPVLGINKPLRGRKGTVYEGGIRVPAFAHWPGKLPAGTTLPHPVHIVDWMPSILKLTDHPTAGQLPSDGRDIWPLLTKAEESPDPRTLYFKRANNFALRHGDWKLVTTGKEKQELFHLAVDPGETKDLSRQNPEQATKLRTLLEQERKNDGDRS
jgi:arylsulfatase A-like enzyme